MELMTRYNLFGKNKNVLLHAKSKHENYNISPGL